MGKISNLFKGFLLAAGISLLSNNLQAQQKIKVVDPLLFRQYENSIDSLKSGIKDAYVILEKGNVKDTLMTDSLGVVELDTLKPEINTNYAPLAPIDTLLVNIQVNATDLSGINKIRLYVDNNLVDSSSSSGLNYSKYFTSGNHSFYATAEDKSVLRNTKNSSLTEFFVTKTDTDFNVNVSSSWNMISLPLTVKDARKGILFPTSTGFAFKYEDIYKKEDTLKTGKGYWLKFNSPGNVLINGRIIQDSIVNVVEGWNLIGILSNNVPVENVKSNPDNIITSNFFGYNGSYIIVDTLKPGKGYWVKINSQGNLIYSSSKSLEKIIMSNELPPNPPSEINENKNLDVNVMDNNILFDLDNAFIKIYDILGREVKTLKNNKWDLTNNNNEKVANGVYAYLIKKNNEIYSGLINHVDNKVYLKSNNIVKYENNIENKVIKEVSKNKENIGTQSKEDISTVGSNIRVTVKDELIQSTGKGDVAGRGNYYDYDSLFSSKDKIPFYIPLFPGSNLLNFLHPGYPDYTLPFDSTSALSFDRWYTFADDTYPLLGSYLLNTYPEDEPIKYFIYHSPCPAHIKAIDSSVYNWEQSTSFKYKAPGKDSIILNAEDLLRKVYYYIPLDSVGIRFDSSDWGSYLFPEWFYPQPFDTVPPVRGPYGYVSIYIYQSAYVECTPEDFLYKKQAATHELKHLFFQPNNSFRENPDAYDDDYFPASYLGKLKKVNNSLQKFFRKGLPRMGVWKED